MRTTIHIIFAFIVTFPIFLFLWKLKKIGWAETVQEFFLADKKVDNNEFVATTVAYGYQIAAISLFASWGYVYGFWTIWVPVFWGIGFQLLRILNDRGYLKKYIGSESTISIHGFLAKSYRSRRLAQLAAMASMVGLSGTAFFEAEFTSSIIVATVGQEQVLSLVLFFIFVIIALIYIVIGGFSAVVATDKIQLAFGFIAFAAFSVITFYKVISNGFIYTGLILFLLTFLCLLALNVLFRNLNRINPDVFPQKFNPVLGISLLVFCIGAVFIFASSIASNTTKDSLSFFLTEQKFSSPLSLGVLSLLSLLLANGLWQIVDISNWQRMASLKYSDELRLELSKTLTFVSLYSPLTWIIAIFFGMSLRFVGLDLPDAWIALQRLASDSFSSESILDNAYILLLIFSMISIMYSTLDSLISSVSYTCYYDIILQGNLEERADLRKARMWTIMYTVTFFVIYIITRRFVSGVDNILYTFYSFQLALFPAIVCTFICKRVNKLSAFLSVIGGSALCLTVLIINSESINPYTAAATFTVVGATLIYLFFTLFKRFEVIINE